MACGNCFSGGCSSKPGGCGSNGSCTTGGCGKLDTFNWLAGMELPNGQKPFDVIEVKFKNTRKEFYRNIADVELYEGATVVVEAASGYDIGRVSLTGELVRIQMQKKGLRPDTKEIKKVLRIPTQKDLDKWTDVRAMEHRTMIETRQIAKGLNLSMKVSDVEYQADRSKATFFYTADDRVDFRQLIKILAERFKIRIEMRQIGARQEAGRLGGIGSCGRELCCSTWLTDFRSVSTSAARYQQLSINPLKLAGQCGKLKCCLNYELDAYVEAFKEFPDNEVKLRTTKGDAFHQKSDIFRGVMWYAYPKEPNKFYELSIERVHEILKMNENGESPADLSDFENMLLAEEEKPDYLNVVGQDSLTRFDSKGGGKRKKRPARGAHQRKKEQNQDKSVTDGTKRPIRKKQVRDQKDQPNESETKARKPRRNNRGPKARGEERKGSSNQGNNPKLARENKPETGERKARKPQNRRPKEGSQDNKSRRPKRPSVPRNKDKGKESNDEK